MNHQHLSPSAPWVDVRVDPADWDRADPDLLLGVFGQLVLIRAFEEQVLKLNAQGLVHGPAHSSIGQEGGAVGSVLCLRPDDTINGSHRGHHQFLAKCLAYVDEKGWDVRGPLGAEPTDVLRRTLAEVCGLARGYCRGRGGSMHLRWREAGAMGTNAIVGGGVPQAAGFAWAHKYAGTDAVSVTYFGDGAANIGSVLETMNLAAAWRLPLCFFIENNQYAVATRVDEVTADQRLSVRGLGFAIPSWRVDGMDPLAVHTAMAEAVAYMRAGNGPTLVEAEVYRYFHQNGGFAGSAFGYRSRSEEDEWRARDPLATVAARLVERDVLQADEVETARAYAAGLMQSLAGELVEADPAGKPGAQRIKPDEWPDPQFCDVGVRGDLAEFDETVDYREQNTFAGALSEQRFIDVVAAVLHRRMSTDAAVVVLGEDIHRLNGGTNGATKGLAADFPERTLGTPISENAFVGMAGGLALDHRFRPVVELMYADFLWVAADQIFNQIAKARHMFGGDAAVPLVLRAKVAIGTGYGSQHSMDPAGIFATSAGWRIAAPSTPFDYVGMMNSALRCEDPVLVIEHVELYASRGPAPVDDLDYCIEVGKASVRRAGADLTVISYLSMVSVCLAAAEEASVDCDVIDLRWLDRASVDWDTIGESIRKTSRVLIVEQGARGASYGAWLADEIQRRYFDWLDAPVERVSGAESSPTISSVLERAAYAGVREVVAAMSAVEGVATP